MSFRSMFGALSELVADSITGAVITGGTITGAIIQTAAAGRRFVMQPFGVGTFLTGYTGVDAENTPASIDVSGAGGVGQPGIGQLFLTSPSMWNAARNNASGQATFYVAGRGDTSPASSELKGYATHARLESEAGGYVDLASDDLRLYAPDSAWLTGAGSGGVVVDASTASVNVNAGNDVNVTATDQIVLSAGTKIDATGETLDLTGGVLNLSGESISRLAGGSTTVTIGSTVSTATRSFAHGGSTAPDIVLCTAANGVIGYYANVDAYNTTNISVRASQRDGTAGSATVTVNWFAIWF